MNKNKIIIFSFLIALSIAFISSCVKENWEEPATMKYPNFADSSNYKIISIDSLKKLWDGDTTLIGDSIIIEGTVISSDETGNIYKELYIQDTTAGLLIQIDMQNIYMKYPLGKKIFVKCGGLYIGYANKILKLGSLVWDDSYWAFGRIQGATVLDAHIFKTEGINLIEPKVVKINELTEDDKQTLIRIDSVQFKSNMVGKTYAATSPPGGSANITDFKNYSILLYNSSFSTFANDTVPEGSGSITCIYSNFWDTKQIYIRSTTDVNFINPRF
jgi:hypothetical protein